MKILKAISVTFAGFLLICTCLGRAQAQDVCLDFTSDSKTFCAALEVMQVGSYMALYGKMTSQNFTGECSPVNGSAIIDGNRVKITLVRSDAANLLRSNDIIHVEIDNSLSGNFKTIGHVATSAPLIIQHVSDEGTVSIGNCPCQCQ